MDISERCEDSNKLAVTGDDAEYPTNTYYPPGMSKPTLKNMVK